MPAPPPAPPSAPLDKSVVLSQTALFVGAVISTLACSTVLVQTARFRSVRRPPLLLLFWRAVSDLLFSVQFLLTYFVQISADDADPSDAFWGWRPQYHELCRGMAFFTQFFAFASEMWLLIICVDLVLTLTQPFRPIAGPTARYHAAVWFTSLATAILLLTLGNDGPSAIHICWIRVPAGTSGPPADCAASRWSRPLNPANWYLFYVWVIAILIIGAIVVGFATARLSLGLQVTRLSSSPPSHSDRSMSQMHACGPHRRRTRCGCRRSRTCGSTSAPTSATGCSPPPSTSPSSTTATRRGTAPRRTDR